MKVWQALLVAIALLWAGAGPALAQVPPRTLADLQVIFPTAGQVPPGMVLTAQGSRSAAEIAASFPDPVDAGSVLATWGWSVNAYQDYVAGSNAGPETPARLEVSLHQFTSNTGAAYALPYYAHGRAVALQLMEGAPAQLGPCEAVVYGNGEATRYLRHGDLLVRITAVMPAPIQENSDYLALVAATDVAFIVLGRAGGTVRTLDLTCQ